MTHGIYFGWRWTSSSIQACMKPSKNSHKTHFKAEIPTVNDRDIKKIDILSHNISITVAAAAKGDFPFIRFNKFRSSKVVTVVVLAHFAVIKMFTEPKRTISSIERSYQLKDKASFNGKVIF